MAHGERPARPPEGTLAHARRIGGALIGHAVQQTVTCGGPTLSREVAATFVTMSLENSPQLAFGLQVAMTLANGIIQAVRHRELNRHRDVAARGFHGITPEKWGQLPEDEREALMAQQQNHSRIVSGLHATAAVVNLGTSLAGLLSKNPLLTSSVLASEARNWAYAAGRETLQATFRGTTVTDNMDPMAGVTPVRMMASAAVYGGAQAIINYVTPLAIDALIPADLNVSGFAITGADGARLAALALFIAAAKVGAARAATNTFGEVVDAFQLTAHEADEGNGGRQRLDFAHTGVDYSRLLTHSPARIAWNSVSGVLTPLTFFMASSPAKDFITRFGSAILFGLTYMVIGQTYQASAASRRHMRDLKAGTVPADPNQVPFIPPRYLETGSAFSAGWTNPQGSNASGSERRTRSPGETGPDTPGPAEGFALRNLEEGRGPVLLAPVDIQVRDEQGQEIPMIPDQPPTRKLPSLRGWFQHGDDGASDHRSHLTASTGAETFNPNS
jgi:hypothetical protein